MVEDKNKDLFISYAKTVYGQDEINAVIKCLNESTQMGRYTKEFEQKIAELFNKKHCLYVNSGSSALYIGIEAFNFEKGSEVITPALTFSTSVGCLVKNDLIPVFVDVEKNTFNINPVKIEEMITDRTVAILAPNLLGNICRWVDIKSIADKYNLIIIEDSADTLGATLNGKSSGYYSDMSITSFYGSHIINCAGNGGALCINDENVLSRAKLLRSWGRSSSLFDEKSEEIKNRFNINLDGIDYDSKFVFETIGYNLEGSEIGASFGLSQLINLQDNIRARQKNFQRQHDFFAGHSDFFINPKQTENSNTAWLAYPVQLKDDIPFTRKEFQIFLEKRNIQTRVIFTGNINRQPGFVNIRKRVHPDGYPNADFIMRNGVLLPCHHGLSEEMFIKLHYLIHKFLKRYV